MEDMVKVFNTLSGKVEPLEAIRPGKFTMYVCGPTVYDDAHIGHGRAYTVYDAVVRYLRYSGLKVQYVRNLTDIDDKIIKRANEEGVSFEEISNRYIDSFHQDMEKLGLLSPDQEPKASETIPEILALIQTLIDSKKAYEAAGDVYFSISTFPEYGKLSKRDIGKLKAGARVEPGEQKKDPLDFALWKKAKKGEPSWKSPWGEGRPGWHIECSAMSKKLLGESIDIHTGGRDLIFPHHENEIAQSEGAHGKPFVKYWMHNGFVVLSKEKMSKSLGNVVTLKSLFSRYRPEAIKFYLLSSHYRSPIDFYDGAIGEAIRGLRRMYLVLRNVPGGNSQETQRSKALEDAFRAAMNDDFNTAKAIGTLFDAITDVNRLYQDQNKKKQEEAISLRETVVRLSRVMGLLEEDPDAFLQNKSGTESINEEKITQLVKDREEARGKKEYQKADDLRRQLQLMGVLLEDSSSGTKWRISED